MLGGKDQGVWGKDLRVGAREGAGLEKSRGRDTRERRCKEDTAQGTTIQFDL